MSVELDIAEEAIDELYTQWAEKGGPSPDTRDECRVVARACALNEDTVGEDELGVIYQMACEGADSRALAAAHLAALKREI